MRKTFVYWFLGLAAVSVTAGCGLFRDSRSGCCGADGCASGNACASTRAEGGRGVVSEPGRAPRSVRIVSPEIPPPLPAKDREPARILPDAKPTEKPANLPAINKAEMLEDEIAIVNREIAALSKKGVKPTVELMSEIPEIVIPDIQETGIAREMPQTAPAKEKTEVPEAGPAKEKTVELKSVHIHYGQEGNFKTVTGQVQQFRKTWRLRYADVGQEDIYGGSVVLEGSDLGKLRDGAHIRVTGVLAPPASRTSSATYRVQSIEILD